MKPAQRSFCSAVPSVVLVMLFVATLFRPSSLCAQAMTLVAAAEDQNWDLVGEKLQSGTDANETQADGMTALHWASFHGNAKAIQLLVETKANVNAKTVYGVTPLSIACEFGVKPGVPVLLENGADVEAKRQGKETCLMFAARQGDAEIVNALITAGANIEAKESSGQTALMWAAEAGNLSALKALIDAGADTNVSLKSGFNAFLFAVRQGRSESAFALIEAGADVNQIMDPKRTGGRHPRKGMSALMLAIESGHFELALELIKRGADPNDQRSGFGPLHALTWVRKTKVGDDPAGDPPPRGSGSVTSFQFIRLLVEAGADVNLQLSDGTAKGKATLNSKGASPMLMASATADILMMKELVSMGADVSLNNADGCTPLMAAAGVGVVAVGEEPGTPEEVRQAVEFLAVKGVDVNAVDKNGETAMHGAAYRNYPDTVEVLSALGADPKVWDRKNRHGWTPNMIASGKRPGSFKPSPETIAALDAAKSLHATSAASTDKD